jgi:hypothetical protein
LFLATAPSGLADFVQLGRDATARHLANRLDKGSVDKGINFFKKLLLVINVLDEEQRENPDVEQCLASHLDTGNKRMNYFNI